MHSTFKEHARLSLENTASDLGYSTVAGFVDAFAEDVLRRWLDARPGGASSLLDVPYELLGCPTKKQFVTRHLRLLFLLAVERGAALNELTPFCRAVGTSLDDAVKVRVDIT